MKKLALNFLALALACASFGPLAADSIGDYVKDVPGIGLISDEVNFEGITLKNLAFVKEDEQGEHTVSDKYVITEPGSLHKVHADYELDSDVLSNLDLHHFIYGLYDDGPQGCLLHSLGVMSGKGFLDFTVKAPEEPGVYQLRFCHAQGYASYEHVKDKWWRNASVNTIMGIVVVK